MFLTPLLLLILVYNIKSAEAELGFLPLIAVQVRSKNTWVLIRLAFYFILLVIIILGLLCYGATLTSVFEADGNSFVQMSLYSILYLAFWSVLFYVIIIAGRSIVGNSLQMVGLWLLFAFIIPAVVYQSISIAKPVNLMTDFIEVRDKQEDLFSNDSLFDQRLVALFPEIKSSVLYQDSNRFNEVRNRSASAVVNELKKESLQPIMSESEEKNRLLRMTYWFNPVSFFQNKFNLITQTHYADYARYRGEIQSLIDRRASMLINDLWNDVRVDKEKYIEYTNTLAE
jgi:ABC-2 type transport system permease protein